eukprot:g24872.t1
MADGDSKDDITHPSQFWDGRPEKMISLRLVLERSMTQAALAEYDSLHDEEAASRIQSLKTIHLDWLGISEISSLEPFESAEVLYLQANRISRIENLDWMPRLQFLALQKDEAVVENLMCLRDLEFLDLSKNEIVSFDEKELPRKINMLNFRGNLCTEASDYRPKLLAHLSDLVKLDGEPVGEVSERTEEAAVDPEEDALLRLAPGPNSGLGAYWMRKDLFAGVTADVKEYIDAYSIEALASDDFSQKAVDAASRSRKRREATPLPTPAGLEEVVQR